MTTHMIAYRNLEKELLALQLSPYVEGGREDEISEMCSDLWNKLDQSERDQINSEHRERLAAKKPETFSTLLVIGKCTYLRSDQTGAWKPEKCVREHTDEEINRIHSERIAKMKVLA